MRLAKLLTPILLFTTIPAGCSTTEPIEPEVVVDWPTGIWAGNLAATPSKEGIKLMNQTERAVYTFAAERGTLALLDFAACVDDSRCASIAPGATRNLPWSQVIGYADDKKEYVVYWWHAEVRMDGVKVAGSIQTVTVTR